MSFRGTSMIFDGVACEEMGLVLYSFDSHKQDATSFASNLSIMEDRIDGRYRSLFYGGTVNDPLTFTMVLCANENRASRDESFDRWDLQKIASWLTGHTEYKWLSIVQSDMVDIRYRCVCTDLTAVEIAEKKWGVTCKVTCDSPFAYLAPRKYRFDITNYGDGMVFSESTHNGFYYPTLRIDNFSGGDIEIAISNSTESSVFSMKGLPSDIQEITIDCENEVISASSGANLYQHIDFTSGFHFPRFVRGDNRLAFVGSGVYEFQCEWPVNVGG